MINNLYWYICKAPNNMGDWISPYLFEKMTGQKAKRVAPSCGQPFILSCGSILGSCNRNTIVWGTGTMFRAKVNKPLKVLAVRGPITRQVLLSSGVQCPEVYGDPGLLLPRFYTPTPAGHYRVGIIPHYSDHEYMAKTFGNIPDIHVIDINRSVEKVCDDIKACDVTISSSLHGIIVSHAYDVKSAWMTASKFCKWPIGGGKLKYMDYYLSRGVDKLEPIPWNVLPKNAEHLYNLINSYPQPTSAIDIDKLLASCPFGKTRAEILNNA